MRREREREKDFQAGKMENLWRADERTDALMYIIAVPLFASQPFSSALMISYTGTASSSEEIKALTCLFVSGILCMCVCVNVCVCDMVHYPAVVSGGDKCVTIFMI